MPNVKRIITEWNETGKTLYCIVRREADNYRLNDADGAFSAAPADPYVSLTEDAVIKGLYQLDESRTAWNDGRYTVIIYKQAGGAPAPAADTVIASGDLSIKSDFEVVLDSPVPTAIQNRQEMDANSTKLAASATTTDTNAIATYVDTLETSMTSLLGFVTASVAKDSDIQTLLTRVSTTFTQLISDIRTGISSDHGEGLYGSGTARPYNISIRTIVKDSDPVIPIPGVSISLFNADESVLIDHRDTDSMGYAEFPVNDGEYTAVSVLARHSFDKRTILVDGANTDDICPGIPFVVPAPIAAGIQILTGSLILPDGSVAVGKKVTAYPTHGQTIDPNLVVFQKLDKITDENGMINPALELLKGVEYTVKVKDWGEVTFTVGNEDTYDLFDYLP